jgi:predicted nucleic acid-binding protein
MVCLDTSVLVALIRKDQAAIDGLTAEAERGGTVSTTVVNLCELYSGAYGSKNPRKELARVQDLVSDLGLLELDAGAAKRYGELLNDATLRRAPIGDFDLIIASIALEQGEKLVTRNVKHFSRVPGLATEQW